MKTFCKYIVGITLLLASSMQAQVEVKVNLAALLHPEPPYIMGFLHGNPRDLDFAKVSALKPAQWRLGAYALAGSSYEDAARYQPSIMLNVNDYYMVLNNIIGQQNSQPWLDNWKAWEATLQLLVNNSKAENKPVAYWDIFGEPDNFWTGTYEQLLETYQRSAAIIYATFPDARIIGPELGFATCNFSVAPVLNFLDDLHARGITLGGVSWHEFCLPQQAYVHVLRIRDSLANRPWAANMHILIPEYGAPTSTTIPGWNAGWMYYLEKAGVDWASHACWEETDGTQTWSNCEHGLNGLFLRDNQQTQANYWVHRAYASHFPERRSTTSTHPQVVTLASARFPLRQAKIMIGYYNSDQLGKPNAPIAVNLRIQNFLTGGASELPYAIERIPASKLPVAQALKVPELVTVDKIDHSDEFILPLPPINDGEVLLIYLNTPASVLLGAPTLEAAAAIQVYPNPVQNTYHVYTDAAPLERLTWYDLRGNELLQIPVSGSEATLDVPVLPDGLYLLAVRSQNGSVHWNKMMLQRVP